MFYRPTANITDVNIQWKKPKNNNIDSEGRLRTKLYAKRDHFNFPIVNLPFTCICRKKSSSICISHICIWYLSDDTTSDLLLRKATTSNLTIHGLIQPTNPWLTTLNITTRMRIIFIFYFNYNLNIHRRRSRPDSVGKLKGQPDNKDNHPPPGRLPRPYRSNNMYLRRLY